MADDNPTEEWRIVEDAPDYEVSSLGRVRRATDDIITHWITGKSFVRRRAGWLMATFPHKKSGYIRVTLYGNRNVKTSTLICRAFHGPKPAPHYQAAHNDGNKLNNKADNLRWSTPKENCGDRVVHGTHRCGEQINTNKLTRDEVVAIRRLLGARNLKQSEIAAMFGISRALVSMIKTRATWNWL